ncbi:hypothetical protein F0562_032213 [Nyssa sinensis]|uniref:non-specific serine/threonine protein kinase n=1 Tax=Nyssa sinensis TaxID=561372 RepID=A0A5J5AXX7_9ASTE|nr:hypothetical protein F0562_032213 [Nyssa sinensis]
MKVWDSFSTTLCCRNALTALSQALAEQARDGKGNIFIDEAEWRHCSGFFQPQQSVSVQSCGFVDLFNGSTECSSVSLTSIREEQSYKDASRKCSQFSTSTSSSFDDTCRDCSRAVVEARDRLLDKLNVKKNGREKAICGVAVVISIAASREFDDHNNSLVDDFYSCLPALDVMEPGYIKIKSSLAKAVLAILIATVGLVLLIMLMKYVTKSKLDYRKSVKSKEITTWSSLYRFSKEEIENALNNGNGNGNHDQREFLGRGSAGQVYKGVLPSGQVVAIKQIYKTNNSDSFSREVDNLSRVRHPNLVSLFGCCMEDGDQYLVYEYCSAGNLAQHLRRTDTLLTWQKRVKILRDCALALRYLHHHIDGCIVHRDIKLTNILLTEKLEPKLSDFGLAKLLGMEESKVFTDVRGTIGYMDPEYMSNAKLTCASDVYSFGIVALQLLSGQKVIELDLDARDQLTRKVRYLHKRL